MVPTKAHNPAFPPHPPVQIFQSMVAPWTIPPNAPATANVSSKEITLVIVNRRDDGDRDISFEGRDIPVKLPPYTASAAVLSGSNKAAVRPTTALARTGSAAVLSSLTSRKTRVATDPTACQTAQGSNVFSQFSADSFSARLPPANAYLPRPVLIPVRKATTDVAKKAVAPNRPPTPRKAFPP